MAEEIEVKEEKEEEVVINPLGEWKSFYLDTINR
jgi:hypothetical protein